MFTIHVHANVNVRIEDRQSAELSAKLDHVIEILGDSAGVQEKINAAAAALRHQNDNLAATVATTKPQE